MESAWDPLTKTASWVRETLEDYFDDIRVPTISSLVLPYTAGVLLDDLAQPPNYNAPGRHLVIGEVVKAIQERRIDPQTPKVLMRFPPSYERAIRLARDTDLGKVRELAGSTIVGMVDEIQSQSILFRESMFSEDRKSLTIEARREAQWT